MQLKQFLVVHGFRSLLISVLNMFFNDQWLPANRSLGLALFQIVMRLYMACPFLYSWLILIFDSSSWNLVFLVTSVLWNKILCTAFGCWSFVVSEMYEKTNLIASVSYCFVIGVMFASLRRFCVCTFFFALKSILTALFVILLRLSIDFCSFYQNNP